MTAIGPTTPERDALRRHWLSVQSGPVAETVFADLLSRWSSPGRTYHNVEHLRECMDELETAVTAEACGVADFRPVSLALWFHDAIYDPTRSDNESSSAELAVAVTAAWQGHPALALGSAWGANIVNMSLVLGATVLVVPITVRSPALSEGRFTRPTPLRQSVEEPPPSRPNTAIVISNTPAQASFCQFS